MSRGNIRKKIIVTTLVIALIASALTFGGQATQNGKSLIIKAPDSVFEMTNFTVFVTNENGAPLDNVTVKFCGEIRYTVRGTAYLWAPPVNQTKTVDITAEKSGYDTVKAKITIVDVNRLFIYAPYSVYDGDGFSVFVSDDNGRPVQNAKVTFSVPGFSDMVALTNYNGSVSFIAPLIKINTAGSLLAEKKGYVSAQTQIYIMKRLAQLVLYAPSSVQAADWFSVHVEDTQGHPIAGALVSFIVPGYSNQTQLTNLNGTAWFFAPNVTSNTIGYLSADKDGYLPAYAQILIRSEAGQNQLFISAPSVITEGESFQVMITSDVNTTVPDVQVTFYVDGYGNISKMTDSGGLVQFIAPLVDGDVMGYLYAYKAGYTPAQASLLIQNEVVLEKLLINVSSMIPEGATFPVHVRVNGTPVSNATVYFHLNGCNGSGNHSMVSYTDRFGIAWFTAPEVSADTLAEIFAYKTGYLPSDVVVITIKNIIKVQSQPLEQLPLP
jgi:hypothetical protein